ncbi:DUF3592 domain-containing protein [Pseudomonas syringae pv. actinidiae]|nr:DUF3592 domain-containing protein [Pseudomonas syringae pv. actinidiae]
MKTAFIVLVIAFAAYELIRWMKIDKKISSALSWISIDAKLMDTQAVDKKGKMSRLRQQCDYFAFATFSIDGKDYGCQQISFYPTDHVYNQDVITEASQQDTITVWHNPSAPGENVMLSPHEHERNWLMAKTGLKILAAFVMMTLAALI